MSEIAKILPYSVDLDKPIGTTIIPTIFATGNNLAHRFELMIIKNGIAMDLSGVSVLAKFVRCNDRANGPNGSTVEMSDKPWAFVEDGKAIVVLKDACYAKPGKFTLTISLTEGEVISTVFHAEGGITRSSTDIVVTDEQVITLDAIFAQMTAMKNATQEAEDAADAADTAAAEADTAANNANASALKIDGMTVSAEKAENASAAITEVDGVKHISFKLPKGDKGDKGDPGTIENVTITSIAGLPEALNSKQPVGNYAKTINGITADASGNVQLDADDVGALPASGTAVNADKLGNLTLAELMLSIYPIGSIYMSLQEISPAVLFGGTWEMRSNSFLVGAGDLYAVGSTGGEAEHALTVDEIPEHAHDIMIESKKVQSGSTYARVSTDGSYTSGIIGTAGGGLAHNNLPPYLAVYIWERVG